MAQNTTSPFNSKLIVRDILNLNTKYYIPEGGRGRGLLTGRISEPDMSGVLIGGLVLGNVVIGSLQYRFKWHKLTQQQQYDFAWCPKTITNEGSILSSCNVC